MDTERQSELGLGVKPKKPASSDNKFSIKDLTRDQYFVLIILAFAVSVNTIALSFVVPLYPTKAEYKGLNNTEIGLIIGIYQLLTFLLSPVLGKYMALIGSKRMFYVGLMINGIASISFGFLVIIPAGSLFFWASMLIRCILAFGNASFATSTLAVGAKCAPNMVSTIFGLIATFIGIGYTLGPIAGSALFHLGGFILPFTSFGCILIVLSFISCIFLNEGDDESVKEKVAQEQVVVSKGILTMLRIPVSWLIILAVVNYAVSLSFFDASLADHVKPFHSSYLISLCLFFMSGTNLLISPFVGVMLDKFRCFKLLMYCGSIVGIFSALFMGGPSPVLGIEKNAILIVMGFAVMGVATAALFTPTFQMYIAATREEGYEESSETYGCISGIIQSAIALGGFLGSTMGGLSAQFIGFPNTAIVVSGLHAIFLISLTTFHLGKRFTKPINL